MATAEYLTVSHLDRKTLTRLFSKITINPQTGCWEWQAARINGYGVVWFEGRNESSHRLIWAWLVGPLQRGLGDGIPQLDHIGCDNPPCCNPAHIRLTDQVGNLARTNAVSAVNRTKTHCVNGHLLPTEPNRWNGYGRSCRTCNNDRQREAHRRKSAAKRAERGLPPNPPRIKLTAEERAEKRRAYNRQWLENRRAKLQQHTGS